MAFFNPDRPAYREDPYPSLARLRREEPVHYSREMAAWILTAYDDCLRVLQDHDAFSSDLDSASGPAGKAYAARRKAAPLGDVPVLSNSDPPDHTRLRTIVSRAFTPRALEAMRPRVEAFVRDIMDKVEGPFELMNGLAAPLVTTTILDQLGVPKADHEQFRGLTVGIIMAHSGEASRLDAARPAYESLNAMIDRWQSDSEVSETSVLGAILAAPDNETVTRDEMLMLLINIALSGNGATINGIGNAVLALAQNPHAARQLLAHEMSVADAIDELLRFDSPAHIVTRIATSETRIGARTIRAGDTIHAVIGAANRDPARFSNPDTLDLARQDNRHLTFGYADHFCLGAPLARIQVEAVLTALFERYGLFQVTGIVRGDSILMRGPAKVTISSR
jgi:cytochrome P450